MNILKQAASYLVLILILGLSIKYEFMAYSSLLAKLESDKYPGGWASIVAVALNIGKFLCIQDIVDSNRSFKSCWRTYTCLFLLMTNSFIWSLASISVSLDSPQLEQVAAEKKEKFEVIFDLKKTEILSKYKRIVEIKNNQANTNFINFGKQHQNTIDLYESQLTLERENKNLASGFFKGDKYKDISNRLADAKSAKNQEYKHLQENKDKEMKELNKLEIEELKTLSEAYSKNLESLDLNTLKKSGNERIQAPMLTNLLHIINDMVTSNISYIQLVAYTSLLMALIIELLSFCLVDFIRRLKNQNINLVKNRRQPQSIATNIKKIAA